jgi:hypothetical protein
MSQVQGVAMWMALVMLLIVFSAVVVGWDLSQVSPL